MRPRTTSREQALAVLPVALAKLVPDAMQNRTMRSGASSSAAIVCGLRRDPPAIPLQSLSKNVGMVLKTIRLIEEDVVYLSHLFRKVIVSDTLEYDRRKSFVELGDLLHLPGANRRSD